MTIAPRSEQARSRAWRPRASPSRAANGRRGRDCVAISLTVRGDRNRSRDGGPSHDRDTTPAPCRPRPRMLYHPASPNTSATSGLPLHRLVRPRRENDEGAGGRRSRTIPSFESLPRLKICFGEDGAQAVPVMLSASPALRRRSASSRPDPMQGDRRGKERRSADGTEAARR